MASEPAARRSLTVLDGAAPVAAMRPGDGPDTLNLSLSAPCEQHCSFCTLHTTVPVSAETHDRAMQVFARDLRAAGAAGSRTLRINGIEPLAATYLFDLLAVARASGFTRYEVYSTCRPLADRAFAERFVAAVSPQYKIVVPLYGSTAAVHDAVVGVDGAFETLHVALAHLRRLDPSGRRVHFQTVATRQNLPDLPAILRHVMHLVGGPERYCGQWRVHLPFPSSGPTAEAAYDRVAVSMSELLASLYAPGTDARWDMLEVGEVLPCVALRYQHTTGQELQGHDGDRREPLVPSHFRGAPSLAANRYVGSRIAKSTGGGSSEHPMVPTAPCPHRGSCVLGDSCRGEVYALYARRFGLDELRAVTPRQADTITSRRARARRAALRAWWRVQARLTRR